MLLGWSIFSYSKILYAITISCLIVFFSMYHFLPQIVDAHIQQYEIEYSNDKVCITDKCKTNHD